jgi:hypothetical protein
LKIPLGLIVGVVCAFLPLSVLAKSVTISSADGEEAISALPEEFVSILQQNGISNRPVGSLGSKGALDPLRISCAISLDGSSDSGFPEGADAIRAECNFSSGSSGGDQKPLRNSWAFARAIGSLEAALAEGPRSLGFTDCEKNLCQILVADIACEERAGLSVREGRYLCRLENGER